MINPINRVRILSRILNDLYLISNLLCRWRNYRYISRWIFNHLLFPSPKFMAQFSLKRLIFKKSLMIHLLTLYYFFLSFFSWCVVLLFSLFWGTFFFLFEFFFSSLPTIWTSFWIGARVLSGSRSRLHHSGTPLLNGPIAYTNQQPLPTPVGRQQGNRARGNAKYTVT